jgi:hypothetical protein
MITTNFTLGLNLCGDGISTSVDIDANLYGLQNRLIESFVNGTVSLNYPSSTPTSVSSVAFKKGIVTVSFSAPLDSFNQSQNNVYVVTLNFLISLS